MGVFEFVRMPMGLKGSSGTFQRVMYQMLRPLKARVFCYIDDIILTSRNTTEHLQDIDEVLTAIEESGIKLKLSKAKFAQNTIKFLGYIVSEKGLISFYRRMIKDFSKLAAPLTELTKKDQAFHWDEEQQQAFEALKTALCSSPVLAAPKLGHPFVIETDASGKGVGAVLLQAQDKEGKDLRVIAFASRVYNKHERKYPAIELEALGVVYAIQKFKPYIDGAKTTVITDHSPLKSLLYRADLQGRLAKYQIILQGSDIEIKYQPGKQNIVADTLSRNHPEDPTINSITPEWINLELVKEEQSKSLELQELKSKLNNFVAENGVIYKRKEDRSIVCLPKNTEYGQVLIKKIHEAAEEGAHLGREKTIHKVKEILSFPGMEQAISKVVETCDICQINKDAAKKRTKAVLHKFPPTQQPFERVHCDFIGPLPVTERGFRNILVFVCALSKFIIAEPTMDQKAFTTIAVISDRLFSRFGIPRTLVSDQGTNFQSAAVKAFLLKTNCKHQTSTAYHHLANGQVERANQTIKKIDVKTIRER
uniref:RNA-directed DNA polymerase n=1 Tax=Caenorhabditis tropicalis TaxID=1561998 RepID=A0A1I7T8V5_9PELO